MLGEADTIISISFWWFMIGLGGGTVYMLQPLTCTTPYGLTELKISEGFGHVFGILVQIVIFFIFGVKIFDSLVRYTGSDTKIKEIYKNARSEKYRAELGSIMLALLDKYGLELKMKQMIDHMKTNHS